MQGMHSETEHQGYQIRHFLSTSLFLIFPLWMDFPSSEVYLIPTVDLTFIY